MIKLWFLFQNHPGLSLGWLEKLEKLGITEEQSKKFEEIDQNAIKVMAEEKKRYYEEKPKIRKQLEEFKDEITKEYGEDWIKDRRLDFLKPLFQKLNNRIKEIYDYYFNATERDVPHWVRSSIIEANDISKLEKERKKISSEIYFIENADKIKNQQITEHDIAIAKDFPFDRLIETNRNKMALCPFHNEKRPSFWIKSNFGFCFSCGKSCDTIQFIIETKDLSFVEAVKYLNNI